MNSLVSKRTRMLACAGALGITTALAAFAPGAQAAFTTQPCQGADILGRGASLQNTAQQNLWIPYFEGITCNGRNVDYNQNLGTLQVGGGGANAPTGSGSGLRSAGQRSRPSQCGALTIETCKDDNSDGRRSRNPLEKGSVGAIRYFGTDEPPSQSASAEIVQGTNAAGDEAEFHTIPVAAAAVPIIVNWPDGCDRAGVPVAQQTHPGDAARNRIRLTATQVENIFHANTVTTWRQLFPTLADTVACNAPIRRVVRSADSGTTFALKDFLFSVDNGVIHNGLNWRQLAQSGSTNTTWPNDSGSTAVIKPVLTGNDGVADSVNATDGSVGYGDLAIDRAKGFDIDVAAGNDIDKFWAPISNTADQSTFREPTQNAAEGWQAGITADKKGANCGSAQFRNFNSSGGEIGLPGTLGDFSQVSGVNSVGTGAYPICTLTYVLAFDDYARAYGCAAQEERNARTVRDYLDMILTDGQGLLLPGDYAPVSGSTSNPASLRGIAFTGASSVDFAKTGVCGTGGSPPPPPPPPPPGDTGGIVGGGSGTGTVPAPAGGGSGSGTFSVSGSSVNARTGVITVTVKAGGAGVFDANATATLPRTRATASKKITVGKTQLRVNAAGTYRIVIRPSAAAKSALRKAKKLKVSIAIKFTPTGGQAGAAQTSSVTLKAVQPKRRRST